MNPCFALSFLSFALKPQEENIQVSPSIIIRAAQPKDLKGVVEILTDCFYPPQTFWSWIRPLFKLGIYEDLRSRLRSSSMEIPYPSPDYRCLVASQTIVTASGEQEKIIGTVEIAIRSSKPVPYISNLAVSPDYRRQGIARKLLLKCDRIALEWGFQELSLHVLDDNLPAQKLYFSHGYHLERIDGCLSSWLFNRPKRLLLHKKIEQVENA